MRWHFDVLCAKTFLDLFMKWRVDSAVQEDPASALAFVSREVKGVLLSHSDTRSGPADRTDAAAE
jgi:hypothetical protein